MLGHILAMPYFFPQNLELGLRPSKLQLGGSLAGFRSFVTGMRQIKVSTFACASEIDASPAAWARMIMHSAQQHGHHPAQAAYSDKSSRVLRQKSALRINRSVQHCVLWEKIKFFVYTSQTDFLQNPHTYTSYLRFNKNLNEGVHFENAEFQFQGVVPSCRYCLSFYTPSHWGKVDAAAASSWSAALCAESVIIRLRAAGAAAHVFPRPVSPQRERV
jgi:hypothetical protein